MTVVSMGIPATERLLRDALSRGADEGILLSDRAFAGADTLATSYSLACAIKQLPQTDLVICGKMAVDGDTAQIGPELAGVLGIPCITDVQEILGLTDEKIRIKKGVDGGFHIVEGQLPVVITVAKEIREPRMPSIAGIRYGENGTVAVKNALDVGADPARTGLSGSPTQVVTTFTLERETDCVPLYGTPEEQAQALKRLMEEMGV